MIPRSTQSSSSQSGERETERTGPNVTRREPRSAFLNSSGTSPSSSDDVGLPSTLQNHQYRQQHASISSTISASAAVKVNNADYDAATSSFAHNLQHQLERHQQQQPPSSTTALPRSNPIAIKRQPDGTKATDHVDSGDDSEDDETNDSDVDNVERDAIKLNKKYGGPIVQTYQAPSNTAAAASYRQKTAASSALNAPYLGSLSRSANQVLSLPPMSLAGDTLLGPNEEPPESITGYGSLRDSHQRGRFLDGPSSYREPTSGKIRQLDHRVRYHGTGSSELSIGERMQQARKLKESLQKESKGRADEKQTTKATTQSSLSAIMNDVSKQSVSSGDEAGTDTLSSLGEEILMPVKMEGDTMTSLGDYDRQLERDTMDTPSMLSTSMTAFEMLKMSNVSSNFSAMSLNQPSSSRYASGLGVNEASSAACAPTVIPTDQHDDARRFQPLARSMSDPTPRLQQMSLREATVVGPVYQTHQFSPGMPPQQAPSPQQPFGAVPPYGYATGAPIVPTSPDHDPDTDGAFGDLEME
jgi:hypothetical protein